jgi:predicted Zn-dependent protease with MMP-like domain
LCGVQIPSIKPDLKVDWEKLHELALAEIEKTLSELPKPLQEQAQ